MLYNHSKTAKFNAKIGGITDYVLIFFKLIRTLLFQAFRFGKGHRQRQTDISFHFALKASFVPRASVHGRNLPLYPHSNAYDVTLKFCLFLIFNHTENNLYYKNGEGKTNCFSLAVFIAAPAHKILLKYIKSPESALISPRIYLRRATPLWRRYRVRLGGRILSIFFKERIQKSFCFIFRRQ